MIYVLLHMGVVVYRFDESSLLLTDTARIPLV